MSSAKHVTDSDVKKNNKNTTINKIDKYTPQDKERNYV